MSEPLPATGYGFANWTDYINNWRESDAEWLMARTNIKIDTTANRNALSAAAGQVVYNQETDQMEFRSKTGTGAAGWKEIRPLPSSLSVVEGTTTVLKYTTAAAGKGIVFSDTEVGINHQLNVLNGVLTVPSDLSGVTIKTGAKTVKLSTDTANLVSDSPISVPSLNLTGSGTVLNAAGKNVTVGAITADSLSAPAVTVPGSGVLTVGSGTAGSATIGGVGITLNKVTASAGLQSGTALFNEDASGGARIRHTNGTGPYFRALAANAEVAGGGNFDIYPQMRVMNNQPIKYGTSGFNFAPNIYSGSDPASSVAVPDGTIWIS